MTPNQKIAALKARLRLPMVAAPMFLVSGPDLVVAAAKAGILGAFPGPNGRTIDDLRQWFEQIHAELGPLDLPFAFNMITHNSYGRFEDELALVREFKPEIVITALGGPHRVTEAVHSYGGMVFADVNSPAYAKKAIEKGADGLVLVCAGAGGHTGHYAMAPFIQEVRQFFDGPLAVGGGISTGDAMLATETLGADLAYVGTRFLTAEENMIGDDYRNMVIGSGIEDLVASKAITGAMGLWMKASIEAAGMDLSDMDSAAKIDFSGDMHAGTKAWKTVWSAGQGCGVIDRVEPVAAIVDRFEAEYRAAGQRMADRFAPTADVQSAPGCSDEPALG
ncbi:NAD(P)H-dependent flavin oxidoreductase [Tropicibacter naphthalenivorans]|uniref:Putative enoyl-[acyl-carrier-protein] reductase II n=1 Tax=Tropicibacter naphthalenivorans TaxID=441103 RepID=A0A0N7M185_9RHOB|nr:nitronate monooxygenase [Tropicibacter naphthalenivorans]CUH82561.1 putative enoyl-[acyl-carrier-protein] reductase II [Tropicibacter naphthalenivorans]SMD11788.1 nitronate monooxygenase [Tropicibacter naphthalenivorans]